TRKSHTGSTSPRTRSGATCITSWKSWRYTAGSRSRRTCTPKNPLIVVQRPSHHCGSLYGVSGYDERLTLRARLPFHPPSVVCSPCHGGRFARFVVQQAYTRRDRHEKRRLGTRRSPVALVRSCSCRDRARRPDNSDRRELGAGPADSRAQRRVCEDD